MTLDYDTVMALPIVLLEKLHVNYQNHSIVKRETTSSNPSNDSDQERKCSNSKDSGFKKLNNKRKKRKRLKSSKSRHTSSVSDNLLPISHNTLVVKSTSKKVVAKRVMQKKRKSNLNPFALTCANNKLKSTEELNYLFKPIVVLERLPISNTLTSSERNKKSACHSDAFSCNGTHLDTKGIKKIATSSNHSTPALCNELPIHKNENGMIKTLSIVLSTCQTKDKLNQKSKPPETMKQKSENGGAERNIVENGCQKKMAKDVRPKQVVKKTETKINEKLDKGKEVEKKGGLKTQEPQCLAGTGRQPNVPRVKLQIVITKSERQERCEQTQQKTSDIMVSKKAVAEEKKQTLIEPMKKKIFKEHTFKEDSNEKLTAENSTKTSPHLKEDIDAISIKVDGKKIKKPAKVPALAKELQEKERLKKLSEQDRKEEEGEKPIKEKRLRQKAKLVQFKNLQEDETKRYCKGKKLKKKAENERLKKLPEEDGKKLFGNQSFEKETNVERLRKLQQEEDKIRAEKEILRKVAELDKLKKLQEEEERRRVEEEKLAEDAERERLKKLQEKKEKNRLKEKRLAEIAEQEPLRKLQEEKEKRLLEEEKLSKEAERQRMEKLQEEEEKRRLEEEKIRRETELARLRKLQEEEEKRRIEEEKMKKEVELARLQKLREEEEERRLEEEKLKKEAELARLKKLHEEEEKCRLEEEKLKKEAELARLKKLQEEEEKRWLEEEKLKKEAELARLKKLQEEEEKRQLEEEKILKEAEIERLRILQEEEEEKRRLEEEKLKKGAELERLKKLREEEEMRRLEEEKLKREAELERLRKLQEEEEEEEEKRRIEEENIKKEVELARLKKLKEEEERRRFEGKLKKEAELKRLKKLREEEEIRRLEEEKMKKVAEVARLRKLEEEEERRIKEENLKKEAEVARLKKAKEEEEKRRIKEEKMKRDAEIARLKKLKEEKEKRRMEEEKLMKEAELARIKELQEEEDKRRLEEEKLKKEAEVARLKKLKKEEEKKRLERERLAKIAENERLKNLEEEKERRRLEQEIIKKEAELKRLRKLKEEEKKRIEEERAKKEAEVKRLKKLEEEKRRIEEERAKKEAEVTRLKKLEEEEKRRIEEERAKKEAEVTRLKKLEEEEKRRIEEERAKEAEVTRLKKLEEEEEKRRIEEERIEKEVEVDRLNKLQEEEEKKRLEEKRLSEIAELEHTKKLQAEKEKRLLEEERLNIISKKERLQELQVKEKRRIEGEGLEKEAELERIENSQKKEERLIGEEGLSKVLERERLSKLEHQKEGRGLEEENPLKIVEIGPKEKSKSEKRKRVAGETILTKLHLQKDKITEAEDFSRKIIEIEQRVTEDARLQRIAEEERVKEIIHTEKLKILAEQESLRKCIEEERLKDSLEKEKSRRAAEQTILNKIPEERREKVANKIRQLLTDTDKRILMRKTDQPAQPFINDEDQTEKPKEQSSGKIHAIKAEPVDGYEGMVNQNFDGLENGDLTDQQDKENNISNFLSSIKTESIDNPQDECGNGSMTLQEACEQIRNNTILGTFDENFENNSFCVTGLDSLLSIPNDSDDDHSDTDTAEETNQLEFNPNQCNFAPNLNVSTALANMYNCIKCGQFFRSDRSLKDHTRCCMVPPYLQCVFCFWKTNRKNTLRKHIKVKHKNDCPPMRLEPLLIEIFRKSAPLRAIAERAALLDNTLLQDARRLTLKCDECFETFSTKARLQKHIFKRHWTMPVPMGNISTETEFIEEEEDNSAEYDYEGMDDKFIPEVITTEDPLGDVPDESYDDFESGYTEAPTLSSAASATVVEETYGFVLPQKTQNFIAKSVKTWCPVCDEWKTAIEKFIKCQSCDTPYIYGCKWCPQQKRNYQMLRVHVIRHHTERIHTCGFCGHSFSYIQDYRHHLRFCGKEKNISCPNARCLFKTKYKRSLKHHLAKCREGSNVRFVDNTVHAKPQPYVIPNRVIHRPLSNFIPIRNDDELVNRSKPKSEGNFVSQRKRQLDAGVLTENPIPRKQRVLEPIPKLKFYFKKNGLENWSRVRPSSKSKHLKKSNTGRKYTCFKCGRSYNTNSQLSRHLSCCSKVNMLVSCDHCSFKTVSKPTLVAHIHSKHAARLFRGIEAFSCANCRQVFRNYFIYERHAAKCKKARF